MSTKPLTAQEEAAYKALARAAKRLREAQERAARDRQQSAVPAHKPARRQGVAT
jgi:hypothetical protein